MKKKGSVEISFSLIIYLILGILFLIFSIFFLNKIFISSDEINQDTLCYQKGLQLFNQEKQADYTCPTKYITFYEDRVEKVFDNDPPDKKPLTLKFDEDCHDYLENNQKTSYKECIGRNVNKRIAEEMKKCWDKFHKGTVPLFSEYTEERQCMVCSVIYFDNIIKDEIGGDYMSYGYESNPDFSLDTYMRRNNPFEGTFTDNNENDEEGKAGPTSYYEYTMDLVDKYVENPYYDYDTQYEYAIILVALNKNRLSALSDRLLNLALGMNDPRGEFINTWEFIENDLVTTRCDMIR